MIKLYSTGCPKCNVLKKKLEMKHIEYEEDGDVDFLLKNGIQQVPILDVDGQLLNFTEANKWINNYRN